MRRIHDKDHLHPNPDYNLLILNIIGSFWVQSGLKCTFLISVFDISGSRKSRSPQMQLDSCLFLLFLPSNKINYEHVNQRETFEMMRYFTFSRKITRKNTALVKIVASEHASLCIAPILWLLVIKNVLGCLFFPSFFFFLWSGNSSAKLSAGLLTSADAALLCCSLHACKAEGNLLLMNIIKTKESHFPLWYKQLVISHEDGIIADLI